LQKDILREKDIHWLCNHFFIVNLIETYKTNDHLYFLIEACIGGELYASLHQNSLYGNIKNAKFYTAGAICAFEYLHRLKIIYRDLKPENLLLDAKGQVKLTDFGLSIVCPGKTYSFVGTPEYMSPELIAGTGHTVATDWWGVGILLFEIATGETPFVDARGPNMMFEKIRSGIDKVKLPKIVAGKDAKDFIKGLCATEPEQRIAMRKGSANNVKKHPFYKGFDWDAFEKGVMRAPYVPKVKSKNDISNFKQEKIKARKPPQFPYIDDGSGWDDEFATAK